MGSLTKRILVAIVAIPPLLYLVFWSVTWPFKIVAALMLGLGLWEYLRMCEKSGATIMKFRAFFALAVLIVPLCLDGKNFIFMPALLVLSLLTVLFGFLFSQSPIEGKLRGASQALFGVYYFGILGSYFFLIRDMGNGSWFLLLLLAATWTYDTGGYVAGNLWGKHKLFPPVSPYKTWEGVAGGAALCVATVLALGALFPVYSTYFKTYELVLIALLLSVTGQIGDLVESMVKRSLKVKDSGGLIPGHGGVFDRIDSLLFNAPVLFYCVLVANSRGLF
jgi:phosphatidate cytidylyltransferase